MPPAAATNRLRARANNENDENVGTTRLTRAKAAALSQDDYNHAAPKQALVTKKSALNPTAQPLGRRRAALGDVSNVTKGEVHIEGKKTTTTKAGLISKIDKPVGVTKNVSRTASTRAALGAKDTNKKPASELKRAASGSGVLGGLAKKRSTSSTSILSAKETVVENDEPVRKKQHTVEKVEKEVIEIKDENDVQQELVEKTTSVLPDDVPDLDAEDVYDPLMVSEYVHEIFDYLKELEVATMPNPTYMKHQEDLEWKMRGILVDWLVEVHTRFHLLPETLFLAINILDRFLSAKVVQLDRLQLVGVTAMFIASKYEEVLSPHVANFRHVADDGFTEAEILSAERYVLSALNYDLSYPNPMNFLRRISKADNYDIQTRTMGKYLMEIALLDHRFMGYVPSKVAAASMYLARKILSKGPWDAVITHYAGYTEEEIEPLFILMVDYLARPVTHEAFFKKYASKKFMKASIHCRQWAKKHAEDLGIDISQPLDVVAR